MGKGFSRYIVDCQLALRDQAENGTIVTSTIRSSHVADPQVGDVKPDQYLYRSCPLQAGSGQHITMSLGSQASNHCSLRMLEEPNVHSPDAPEFLSITRLCCWRWR